jgi:hypothetical protein
MAEKFGRALRGKAEHDAYAFGYGVEFEVESYLRYQGDKDASQVTAIRDSTNGNFVFGGEEFSARIAAALGRRVVPARPGRPARGRS